MNAVDAFRFFNPMGERYELLEARATKTQWIAMKFGMFFYLPRGKRRVDWWPRREKNVFFVTPYWTAPAIGQPLTDQDYPRYRHWSAPPLGLPKLHPWVKMRGAELRNKRLKRDHLNGQAWSNRDLGKGPNFSPKWTHFEPGKHISASKWPSFVRKFQFYWQI